MARKNTFIMYEDWKPFIDGMTDEQIGHVIRGIYERLSGNDFQFSAETKMVADFIYEQVQKNNDKYKEICKKRSESVKKRYDKSNQKNTNVFKSKHNDNDNDNKYENDNDYDNENDNEVTNNPFAKFLQEGLL